MLANLQNPIFTDEAKAREWLEARIWPNGPTCPHCGNADQARITSMHGSVHRAGLYQCNEPECREQFTVTVGTVFERSKIPLTKWLVCQRRRKSASVSRSKNTSVKLARRAGNLALFSRHQACVGLSAGVAALARRERRLL